MVTPSCQSEQFCGRSARQPPANVVQLARWLGWQKSACARCIRGEESTSLGRGSEYNKQDGEHLQGLWEGHMLRTSYELAANYRARARVAEERVRALWGEKKAIVVKPRSG